MTAGLFAYIGPETVVPVASALASILGVALVGFRFVKNAALRLVRAINPRADQGMAKE